MKKIRGTCTLKATASNFQSNIPELIWDNVRTILDFDNGHIVCFIKLSIVHILTIRFGRHITMEDLIIDYKDCQYQAMLEKGNIVLKDFHPTQGGNSRINPNGEETMCRLEFLLLRSVLRFGITQKNEVQRVVFSGNIFSKDIDLNIKFANKSLSVKADSRNEDVTISSVETLSEDEVKLFYLAYSLFQCSELCYQEKWDNNVLELYIQKPRISGTCLSEDCSLLESFLSYFSNQQGECIKYGNAIMFFLAGLRLSGTFLEIRTINLFVFINAICGDDGQFGELIANNFNISNGDGAFLAKVRHELVHEGDSLKKAILDGVKKVKEQASKVLKNNKITYSYPVFGCYVNNQIESTDTANRFYFMLYDLCMEFWIKKIGYSGKIRKIVDIY